MASKKELMRGTPALTHSLTHSPAGCHNKSQAIWQRWVIERINNSFLKSSSKSITGLFKGIGEGKGAGIERERESLVDPRESGKGVRQDAKLNAHEEEEQLLLCVCQWSNMIGAPQGKQPHNCCIITWLYGTGGLCLLPFVLVKLNVSASCTGNPCWFQDCTVRQDSFLTVKRNA